MIIKQTVQHIKSIVLKQCSVTLFESRCKVTARCFHNMKAGDFFVLLCDKTLLDVKILDL